MHGISKRRSVLWQIALERSRDKIRERGLPFTEMRESLFEEAGTRFLRGAAVGVPPVRGIGDNGGPPLDPEPPADPGASWRLFCWRLACKAAWKTPPREIALRRLKLAEALGMTYREYTLEILERGRYPDTRPVRVARVGEVLERPGGRRRSGTVLGFGNAAAQGREGRK